MITLKSIKFANILTLISVNHLFTLETIS